MDFLPDFPSSSTTASDELYVHPFFHMADSNTHLQPRRRDGGYAHRRGNSSRHGSRSLGILTARPVSISSPGEIIKLTLEVGKKTPPLQTTPMMDRFRSDEREDSLLEMKYRSDEEMVSPIIGGEDDDDDDLSSSSISFTDDENLDFDFDDDDEVSLVGDDHDGANDGDVEVEEDAQHFPSSALGLDGTADYDSPKPSALRTCEQCAHAESVRLITPGQAKVIVLGKSAGSARPRVIRRSSSFGIAPSSSSPRTTKSMRDRTAMKRNSIAVDSSPLDRFSSVSSGKAASTTSSNGSSETYASFSGGNTSGNESVTSSQHSSASTNKTSIELPASLKPGNPLPASSCSSSEEASSPQYQRRRRPTLPYLQIKPETSPNWNMGLATPRSGKKTAVGPSTSSTQDDVPDSATFATASRTNTFVAKAAKMSSPSTLRTMFSSARPLRRKQPPPAPISTSAYHNIDIKEKTPEPAPPMTPSRLLLRSKAMRRKSVAPSPSMTNLSAAASSKSGHNTPTPTTAHRNDEFMSRTSSTTPTGPKMIPRPADDRAPLPVLPPFVLSRALSFPDRDDEDDDLVEEERGTRGTQQQQQYPRSNTITSNTPQIDDQDLAELADLMHPGFGFLRKDSSTSSLEEAARSPAARGRNDYDDESYYQYHSNRAAITAREAAA